MVKERLFLNGDADGTEAVSMSADQSSEKPPMSGNEGNINGRPQLRMESTDAVKRTHDVDERSPETPGTRIARLRAAFENGKEPAKRPSFERLSSVSRAHGGGEHAAELARIKAQLAREIELRQEYEEKCTSLEEEIDELHERLEQRDAVWRDEWERKSEALLRERTEALELLRGAESKAKGSESQTKDLQQQLLDLKHSISTSTRIESQVTDSTFAQEMGMLNHEVQNWVVNSFRKAKVDAPDPAEEMCTRLYRIDNEAAKKALQPVYKSFDSSAKLVMFQATTVYFLMEVFNEPYLFGLPADGEVRSAAKQFEASATPASYNRWRSVTFDLIRQSQGPLNEVFGRLLRSAEDRVVSDIDRTLETLTGIESTEARVTSLRTIVHRTISIAHLFRVQRAQYEFTLPPSGSSFDSVIMEDSLLDNDAEQDKTYVRCGSFPCITKMGDEQGDNIQLRNVIVKASVLCAEP